MKRYDRLPPRARPRPLSMVATCWASLLLVLGACTVRPEAYRVDGKDIELVFMHTGDIHSRLIPYGLDVGETDKALGLLQANAPFGGIARLSALVRQERTAASRFAYVETGDIFQGAPVFNAFQGKPEFLALTAMGVDAMAIGNHEFDNGAGALVNTAINYANFPMLAANYLLENPYISSNAPTARITQPYMMINMKGIRVGVIGLGNLGSMRSVFEGGNSQGITPLNTRAILQKYIDFLRPQVDLVIAIGHLGYHEDLEFIPRTEGLDLVFDGHLHIALDPPNVLQDCDITKLRRERDRYICDTPEKLRQRRRACENDKACGEKKGTEVQRCIDGCSKEAQEACDQEKKSHRYAQRLRELDADIAELTHRKCHPRDVVLIHSGAFLKYAGRLQVTVRQCTRLEKKKVCVEEDDTGNCTKERPRRCVGRSDGKNDWEVISHSYKLIPIDKRLPDDPMMLRLLEPYQMELNRQLLLTQVIGYTANRIRRFSTGSGDSQVGNMVADAMQTRNQVWADFAVTNSLGIRSDFVTGPVDGEQMTNVFPFENSISVMFLSGTEVQEMMDFITQRSTSRGCQSQAQVAGITATLNCGGCPGDGGNPCSREIYNGEACAQRVTVGGTGRPCKVDKDCERCGVPAGVSPQAKALILKACANRRGKLMGEICTGQRHPLAPGYTRCWMPISCSRSYKLATNDYIARGGSGFQILERNTTQRNLGISLRKSAVDYMRTMPACGEKPPPSGYLFGGVKRQFLLTPSDEAELKTLEQFALRSEWQTVNDRFFSLAKALKARRDKTKDPAERAGLTSYLRCSDLDCSCKTTADCGGGDTCTRGHCERNGITRCNGLAHRFVRECRSYKVSNIDRCEALGRVHAARRCVTLPCINAQEDGRLQRIFKDSSGSPNPFEPWPE